MNTITGTYICNICNKKYSSYKSLWAHNKKFHTNSVNESKCLVNDGNLLVNESNCSVDDGNLLVNESKCSVDDIINKNKCKYCSKILSCKQSKSAHHKICKYKQTDNKSEFDEFKNTILELLQQDAKIYPKPLQKNNNDKLLQKNSNDIIINKKLDVINTNIDKIKENIPINNQLINIIMDKNKALDELNDKIENTITVSGNKPVICSAQPTLTLNDVVVVSRPSDNYINATQLCKAGNKKFSHWFLLDSTKELINESASDAGIPASLLVDIQKSNSDNFDQVSWIHPQLAIPLAQWLSHLFVLQVSKWILQLFTYEHVEINKIISDQQKEIKLANQRIRRIKKALLFYASYC